MKKSLPNAKVWLRLW